MPERWRSAAFDLRNIKLSIAVSDSQSLILLIPSDTHLLKAGYPFRLLEFHNPEVMFCNLLIHNRVLPEANL